MDLNEALQLINRPVRDLSAYHLEPEEFQVKLNQNENPYDWPSEIKEELAAFCRERPWNRYPDFIPVSLKKSLAGYAGVQPENIIVGNGSNEMLLVLLISLMDRTRPVILCQPTFTMYTLLTKGLGGTTKPVLLNKSMSFDLDMLDVALRQNPRSLAIICSPNNPTGTALSEKEIRRALKAASGFVILDQAYVEFGGYNAIPLLAEFPNLIVTRTVSKAFAAAGVRLGYLIANPEVVTHLNKIKLPYNINFFSQQVVATAVKYKDVMMKRIMEIRQSRDAMLAFLKTLPFDNVYPSEANFILVRCNKKDDLFNYLKKQGILLRDVSQYPLLENCLRISVGSIAENKILQEALSAFFKK